MPSQIEVDRLEPAVVDDVWNPSGVHGAWSYSPRHGFTRLNGGRFVYGAEVDEDAEDEDDSLAYDVDSSSESSSVGFTSNPSTPWVLVNAVLVSDPPPLVEAIAVPPPKSLRQRLSEAGRRLLPKKSRRRAPTDPSQGDEAGQNSSRGSSGESTGLPGAYLVELDNENPEAEIVRAAPVAPSRAARLRKLMRRLVRLKFQLGENRDAVDVEVQVIQGRIDSMEEGNPVVDVEIFNELGDSPQVGADGASREQMQVRQNDGEPGPGVVHAENSEQESEVPEHEHVMVLASEDDKPGLDGVADRAAKGAWERSKDDDATHLPYEKGHNLYGGANKIGGGVPSWLSVSDDVRTSAEEIQRLRDELRASNDELERARHAHQEDLRTAEAEYQRSLAERDDALEEMALNLKAAQSENGQRVAELEGMALALEASQAEFEQCLADKDAELEEMALKLESVQADNKQRLAAKEDELSEMAVDLEAAQAENEQRVAELEGMALALETASAERLQSLAEKDAELKELAIKLRAVHAENKQGFAAKEDELEEMALKLEAVQVENAQRVAELEGMTLALETARTENVRRFAEKDAELEALALKLKALHAENMQRSAAKENELEEMALDLEAVPVSSWSETSDCESSDCESSNALYDNSMQDDDAPSVVSCNCTKRRCDHEMQPTHLIAHESRCAAAAASPCRRASSWKQITRRSKRSRPYETVRCPLSRLSQAWTQRDFDDAFRRLHEVCYPITIEYDMNSDTLPEWTYDCNDCNYTWAEGTAVCQTFLFQKGAPPNTMADLTAGVLQSLISYARKRAESASRGCSTSPVSLFRVKEVRCVRPGMLISTELDLDTQDYRTIGESAIEIEESKAKICAVQIWIALVDASPDSCLEASSRVDPKMQRLIVCAKGFLGEAGEHLWRGGLDVVLASIRTTLNTSLAFDAHEIVCPTCLNQMHTRDASTWSFENVTHGGSSIVRCQKGHYVEKMLICGIAGREVPPPSLFNRLLLSGGLLSSFRKRATIKVRANVQVFVQNSNGFLLEVGSGFVYNRRAGLVVTSGHVLFRGGFVYFPPGRPPKLKPYVRLLISVPCENSKDDVRYDAELAISDFKNIDACVLRVVGSTSFSSKVRDLKLADKFRLLEYVQLCGFNQGGEGRFWPGTYVDRFLDVVPGVVSKHCDYVQITAQTSVDFRLVDPTGYFPREEIAISGLSRAIEGHSGGPCINERGEVLGILSRVDFACATRWYTTPFSQIRSLIERLPDG
jgi:Trypsin-like peptidase domain